MSATYDEEKQLVKRCEIDATYEIPGLHQGSIVDLLDDELEEVVAEAKARYLNQLHSAITAHLADDISFGDLNWFIRRLGQHQFKKRFNALDC
jgi:hypothetical protein